LLNKELNQISSVERTPAFTKWGDNSSYGKKTPDGSVNAVLWDQPAQAGGFDWYHPQDNATGIREVVFKFETWGWCERGSDLGRWYDGVKWEYRLTWQNQSGTVRQLLPNPTEPSERFLAAYQKYLEAMGYVPGN
jgi:hypothetical protein